ncbi:MAG: MetQ/NlpA family ABC transporter substrate-binding protein [Anaerolineae bacterium]|nr:MetQ/NlpA family ABC transporter substrate-binding protein [Thermoflexales bacterium]MDW8406362.1 MetQ/NlpA family ABC transporter substrate-binding protein [Anaerolineae bacterium]
MHKVLSGLMIAGALALACRPVAPAEDTTLKVGALPVLEALPLHVAEAQGYFQEAGIRLEIVPVASAAERDQLMQAGQIDGMINDLLSTVLFNRNEQKIAVVRSARQATTDVALFAIVAGKDSGIETAQDLKGIEIGISESTVIAYVTDRLLQRQGLSPADIRTVNVPRIPDRMQLLSQGQIKAATLPDPFFSLAIQQGAKVVADDRADPSLSVSAWAFSMTAMKTKPRTVRNFVAALDKAIADVNSDPAKWNSLLAEKKLIPASLVGQYTLPLFPSRSLPTPEQFQDVQEWMIGKGLIQSALPYEQLVAVEFK